MTVVRTLLAVITISVAFVGTFPSAQANERYAGMVIDAITGEVFYQDNADARRFPASMTKVMTLYLLFEAIDQGRFTLDTALPVSRTAANQPPSKIGVAAGSTIRVEDAIYALAVKSANDVAVVVAEAVAGSESAFAEQMTETARRIGMASTTFRNASGLPNSRQVSTARDMVRMGQTMRARFPHYYHYFGSTSWTYRGTTYRSHNRLLGSYEGMDGFKTGYINASGFNLLASAERGGLRLMAVVFGGRTAASRNEHMADILDRAFDSSRGQFLIANGSEGTLPPVPPRHPLYEPPVQLASAIPPAPSVAVASAPVVPLPPRRPLVSSTPETAVDTPLQLAAPATPPQQEESIPVLQASAGVTTPIWANPPQTDQGAADDGARWGVQVGAYSSVESSSFALEQAGTVLDRMVQTAEPMVIPVPMDDGSFLYRARLMGLDQDEALAACDALTDIGAPCLPVPPAG